MGCGKYNITSSCGKREYAECVFYERVLPEWSDLEADSCVTTADTTEELYDEVSDIREQLDVSNLGNCFEYDKDSFGETGQREVNKTFESKICDILERLDLSDNMGVGFCPALDYGDLINPDDCLGKPETWCEFAQFVLDKLKRL